MPPVGNDLLEIVLVLVIGGGVIGILTLAYVAVSGLRDSFPPGTADSWNKMWESVQEKAGETPNTYDDLALAIAGPLVEAIMRAIREREEVYDVLAAARPTRQPDTAAGEPD